MLISLGLLLVAGTVHADDPVAGKEKAQKCATCHGPDGNSMAPNFPKLAGQYADYIVQSLQAYKSGTRQNPIMQGMAAPLSEQDMEDIAAYYEQQQGLITPEGGATAAPTE